MTKNYFILFIKITALSLVFISCKQGFTGSNQVAYFGGEVENPTSRFVLFCKDGEVIDSIPLKKDNTFLKKMDSLPAGMYSFKNEPEYQYVYFDANDSIMVHMDSNDFDQSIVFCGKGGEKNNFLIEMFLKNEKDKDNIFNVFDSNFKTFNNKINLLHADNLKFYNLKKEEINWSADFDKFALAVVNLPYYSKKEVYPLLHKIRTGEDTFEILPKDYYSYRDNLDLNDESLNHFSPYTSYINMMLSNIASLKYHTHLSDVDLSLKTSINKLKSADTLIKNVKVKNSVINNIAFQYLLEDQNMLHVNEFLLVYTKISTDKSKKNEITNLGNSIKLLSQGKILPTIDLIDNNNNSIQSSDLIQSKTVFFFWTENLKSHFEEAHKKAIEFQKRHPDYQFISINLDANTKKWQSIISKYSFPQIKEYHCTNFDQLKLKWAITKVHRTIIVNKDKTIKNGFSNMFDVNFENELD